MYPYVYLGNLLSIAALLHESKAGLAACILEKGEECELAFREAGKRGHFPVYTASNNTEIAEALKAVGPIRMGVVANFGIILNDAVLKIPSEGFLNLHFGFLPQNPGRNPVKRVLELGHRTTGVTLHRVSKKIDAGEVIARSAVAVHPQDDAHTLFQRLCASAESLLAGHLSGEVSQGVDFKP